MLRLFAIIVTAAACVAAGVTAGLVAFASELHWPLSEANLAAGSGYGIRGGVIGAVIAAFFLWQADRKTLWIAGAIAVAVTWLVTFAGVWWIVVSSLG